MKLTYKILITLVVLLFISIALNYSLVFSTNSSKLCKNPTKVEDYTDREKRLLICGDFVKYGDTIVTAKTQIPEIFEYKFNDSETWEVNQEIVIYRIKDKEFIAIFPVVNPQTWYSRAGYIFKKKGDSYGLIFKREFKSLSGRWSGVRFDENGSIFSPNVIMVNQDLGALGPEGQRIRWSDYYVWNETKGNYELGNNQMTVRLNDLRAEYNELDNNVCGFEDEELKGKSLTELYSVRKNNERFCNNESLVPFVSNKQAERFLKAKKALSEIAEGQNHSYNTIDNIKL